MYCYRQGRITAYFTVTGQGAEIMNVTIEKFVEKNIKLPQLNTLMALIGSVVINWTRYNVARNTKSLN